MPGNTSSGDETVPRSGTKNYIRRFTEDDDKHQERAETRQISHYDGQRTTPIEFYNGNAPDAHAFEVSISIIQSPPNESIESNERETMPCIASLLASSADSRC